MVARHLPVEDHDHKTIDDKAKEEPMPDIEPKLTNAQKAIAKAKEEIEAETLKAAVTKLKKLYRAEMDAKTVLDNIKREIADYEEAVNQGNL